MKDWVYELYAGATQVATHVNKRRAACFRLHQRSNSFSANFRTGLATARRLTMDRTRRCGELVIGEFGNREQSLAAGPCTRWRRAGSPWSLLPDQSIDLGPSYVALPIFDRSHEPARDGVSCVPYSTTPLTVSLRYHLGESPSKISRIIPPVRRRLIVHSVPASTVPI